MSRRIRVIVQYDGTNYVGWQVQENGISVQQRLNEAAKAITGETIGSTAPAERTACTRTRRLRTSTQTCACPRTNLPSR